MEEDNRNLQSLITRADLLKSLVDGVRPLTETQQRKLDQKLRLDWNYHSNSIEGNTLTVSETRAFILHGITAKGKPFRDYIEMKGHDQALKKLESIINKDTKITESLVKELHKIILVEPYTDDAAEINPGAYKKLPNYLYTATGERLDFLPPEEVAAQMNKLINWLNNHIEPPKRKRNKYDLHPILIATAFHVRFIQIHPFGDGNGRMARIMGNLILMLCGYTPAIIKLEQRKEYYAMLNLSTLENPQPLAEMIAAETIRTLQMTLDVSKGLPIDDDDDLDKRLEMLKRISETDEENIVRLHKKDIDINSFITTVINPLAHAIHGQFVKLEPLFADNYIETRVDQSGVKQKPPIAIGNTVINVFGEANSKNRKEFRLTISHLQYKKAGLKAFDVYWALVLKFEDSKYIISSEGSSDKYLIVKLYHQVLSETDIMEIAKKYFKYVLDKIEYNLENLDNDR